MEANRRPRVVKRVPFFKRILNAPEDYLMRIENDLGAMDWDKLQEGFRLSSATHSWPLAVGLNLSLVSVRLGYWLDDPFANVPTVLRSDKYNASKSLLPGLAALLLYLQYILVSISFLNALWLFLSKKNYKMLHRNLDEKPSASNVRMVEVQQNENHWSLRFPGKLIYRFVSPLLKDPKPQNKLHVWEMTVWNPSIINRNLFCWYSPAQVLITLGMNTDNFHIFFPLSVAVALQVYFLVSIYQSYVKDKQILFAEVHHEYNVKFVHPRLSVWKEDKQISTETDTNDLDLQTFDRNTGVFQSISERKPRKFQHLSVPGSLHSPSRRSPNVVMPRDPSHSIASPIVSRRSAGTIPGQHEEEEEDEDEEEEEDEDEGDEGSLEEEDEDGDDIDEDEVDESEASDSGSDDSSTDPDIEYDEEGEVPKVPHPTNSLDFETRL
ncbi:hypothetical protein BGZ65_002002 [Modicella reniformis]|uniref:Nuclear rim protein 1 n=1 Tax=Modicella reniformis TaxID=1440133 RepID=A0A9P6SNR9_9FUNG|nr:hypothetical protein BGZ65_002002 [Modicella reniformis]